MTAQQQPADSQPPLPLQPLRRMIGGALRTQLVYVAAKLGIADLLVDGPRTSEELARDAGAHPVALRRILRALATYNIFTEESDGRFALNPLAEFLRVDHPESLYDQAIRWGEGDWQIFSHLLESARTGETAHEHAFGMSFFERFAQDPEAAAAFNRNMTRQAETLAPAVVEAYDFAPARLVVDVGGGHGRLLAAILQAHPGTTGLLFDAPAVAEGARSHLEAAGVADRCRLVGGDFFEAVPEGGDAYILSWIIHDWDDERALRILRTCRRAVPDRAVLLLIEMLLPPRAEPIDYDRFVGQQPFIMDLNMLTHTGGQERTEAEYGALLKEAGFELVSVHPLATRRNASLLEARPA